MTRKANIRFETRSAIPAENSFIPYKLKQNCVDHLRSFIHPDKLEALIANVEYYGSKNLQEFAQEETPPCAMAFFDNEFEKEWACIPEDQELLEFPEYFEQNSDTVKKYPVLCRALSGDDTKVSVILSPECFEVDMLFSEIATIQ